MSSCSKMKPFPWELLVELISKFLDPDSLAAAACVCKSWNLSISSEHIWKSLLISHFPSCSRHLLTPDRSNPRRLFSLLYSSSTRRRRMGRSPPRISLRQLLFTIDIFDSRNTPLLSFAIPGEELVSDNSVMRFEKGVEDEVAVAVAAGERLRVVWMVVMKEWDRAGAFSVMEREGKGRVVEGDGVWFSEELPAGPGHCQYFVGGGGLVAELGLGLGLGEGRVIRKVSLGLMSVVEWRYVSLEDGLLYLQQFLLPHS